MGTKGSIAVVLVTTAGAAAAPPTPPPRRGSNVVGGAATLGFGLEAVVVGETGKVLLPYGYCCCC